MSFIKRSKLNGNLERKREKDVAKTLSRSGILGWFANNPVVANLLMLVILIGGIFSLSMIKVEIFPEIDPHRISIRVQYPSASPEQTEESISMRVEEAIRGIDGVERVTSRSNEGNATITVNVADHADDETVMEEVKQAIDQLQNFPPDLAEQPVIRDVQPTRPVMSIAISGPRNDKDLRAIALNIRDVLLQNPEISLVNLKGTRRPEFSIEIDQPTLRQYNLDFQQVANAIRTQSINRGAGSMRTESGDIRLRLNSRAYDAKAFADLPLLNLEDGRTLYIRDVATVTEQLADSPQRSFFNGQPAVYLEIDRGEDQNAIGVADAILTQLDQLTLPEDIQVDVWSNRSTSLMERINLLARNGIMGLILVFGCLIFFMNFRLAFWTTMGIPISFLGAFLLMPLFGISINQISLFGLIIVLGIVVDDAIVVGEHIHHLQSRGMHPLKAAVVGAREMAAPVVLGITTTIAAFMPLMFTEGRMGQIMWAVPAVVSVVLVISLVEALFILPAHLAHHKPNCQKTYKPHGPLLAIQRTLDRGLQWFIRHIFARILKWAIHFRYVTLALMVVMLLLAVQTLRGGWLPWQFFPRMEDSRVTLSLEMVRGTPVSETQAALDQTLAALERSKAHFEATYGDPPIKHIAASVGGQPFGDSDNSGSHLAEVKIAFLESSKRKFNNREFQKHWRNEMGAIPGLEASGFSSFLFRAGDDLSIELAHRDARVLRTASDELIAYLKEDSRISELNRTDKAGDREWSFKLTPQGHAAGLRLSDLSQQIRAAFYGLEADRVQRGVDEMRVWIRLPEKARHNQATLETLWIMLPNNTQVPLKNVATWQESRAPSTIYRADYKRIATISGSVDKEIVDPTDIIASMTETDGFMAGLLAKHQGLSYVFRGEEEERKKSFASLRRGLIIALILIYIMLASQTKSYIQGLVIMSVIPFGFIGTIIGHWLLDYPFTFFSIFGLFALSGILVNDSLILMDLTNRLRKKGLGPYASLYKAGQRRFRAIIFTSLTTFLGLAPILLETSRQAQFLIPMAISLAFGILFATMITLLLVPSVEGIHQDLKRLWAYIKA